MMRKILIVFGFILPMFILATPQLARAAVDVIDPVCNRENSTVSNSTVCKERNPSENPIVGPNGVLTKGIQIVAIIVGISAVFGMVISGFRIITSGGDAGKVASARSGVIFALVGLVVAASAQVIVSFVLSKIG